MKKILLLVAAAVFAFAVNAAPQKVDFGKLPKNSQEFIQKNFPGEKVKAVEMDREASWDKYTVYFNSGNQVSFEGGSGDCSQIIMKNGSVPMSVIPAKIKTYAGNNYAGQRIVMMETTADGYRRYSISIRTATLRKLRNSFCRMKSAGGDRRHAPCVFMSRTGRAGPNCNSVMPCVIIFSSLPGLRSLPGISAGRPI